MKSQEGEDEKGMEWTAIHCSQFFDWGLETGWLYFYPKKREVVIYDSGDRKWASTNIGTVGTAVARVLGRSLGDEAVANRDLLISSFTTSQNELLSLVEEIDGQKWNVKNISSKEALEKAKTVDEDEALQLQVLMLLYADGEDKGANFENDERLANGLLGLEKEDIREVVKRVLKN